MEGQSNAAAEKKDQPDLSDVPETTPLSQSEKDRCLDQINAELQKAMQERDVQEIRSLMAKHTELLQERIDADAEEPQPHVILHALSGSLKEGGAAGEGLERQLQRTLSSRTDKAADQPTTPDNLAT